MLLKKNSIFSGAIIGKAIYEKKIDPKEALNIINNRGVWIVKIKNYTMFRC